MFTGKDAKINCTLFWLYGDLIFLLIAHVLSAKVIAQTEARVCDVPRSGSKYFNCYILLPYQSLQLWTTTLLERLLLLEFSVKSEKHQNPDFGPKPGEIQKKTCKKVH